MHYATTMTLSSCKNRGWHVLSFLLCNVHNDFTGFGVSSMNEEEHLQLEELLEEQLFYGENHLLNSVPLKHMSDRIIGIEFVCNSFSALFLCVYLPYDCSDNHDNYMFYLSKLLQIIDDYPSPYIFVCGDINANIAERSQFGSTLLQLCADHSLCFADKVFLPTDSFTFVSSSHNSTSWLYHILTTTTGVSLLTDICIHTDFITSDHLPLSFSLSIDNLLVTIPPSSDKISYNWYGASDNDINQYYSCSRSELARIKLPLDAMRCKNEHCIKHRHDIDSFYYSIINALDATMKQCIPIHKSQNKNCIRGWNDCVSEFYDRSRTEFKWWVSNNRPRHGPIYHAMRSARAQFKYALRQCRLDERLISCNKLANHMQRHDINAFWKDIRKHTKSKAALSNCIDGITGEADIAGMWGHHYEQLLNDNSNESSKFTVLDSFGNVFANVGMQVTMKEVSKMVSDLPNGKSSGYDGLNSESLKHADPLVCLLLSVCFTCMFTYSYMPSSMMSMKSIMLTMGSDHLPILISLQMAPSSAPSLHRNYVNLKKANWERYSKDIEETLSTEPDPTDCQQGEKILRAAILKAASHHIPSGRHKLDHTEALLADIVDMMSARDDLRSRDPTSSIFTEADSQSFQRRVHHFKARQTQLFPRNPVSVKRSTTEP